MENILELRKVRYRYNGKEVLAIQNMDIAKGSITGLAGPNGSGKTTLLKLLSCVEKPTEGSVRFFKTSALQEDIPLRQKLCLLPQKNYLLKRSVFENIAYGLRVRGRKDSLDTVIADALKLVGLDQSFAGRQWHELSGGEAQRVALAARLALMPDCLLLDEPTASVDMESARCIRRAVLQARKEWGTTLVIASHFRSWLNDICDRVIHLYNGHILDCSDENILTGPWKIVDDRLVACLLSDGQKIYASKPRQLKSSAVIPTSAFTACASSQDQNAKSLQGVISSITLENNHTDPQAFVSCGDQRFVVSIAEDAQSSERYWPGRKVTLCYNPEDITWLEK